MSKRHELERHLQSLSEIRGIMGSMKTLALLETRKLGRFLPSQQQVVAHIESMAGVLCHHFPLERSLAPEARDVFLLLGSERGFCGDFNGRLLDELASRLQHSDTREPLFIASGHKLQMKMQDDGRLAGMLDGASVAEEVEPVLGRLVPMLSGLQAEHGAFRLHVIHHAAESAGVQCKQVLPPFRQPGPEPESMKAGGFSPRLNLDPAMLFADMVEQYLFAELYLLIYSSLLAENRQRMQHLEGAIERLDGQVGGLTMRYNTLRQEEITEEIEVILLSAGAVQQTTRPRRRPRGSKPDIQPASSP